MDEEITHQDIDRSPHRIGNRKPNKNKSWPIIINIRDIMLEQKFLKPKEN